MNAARGSDRRCAYVVHELLAYRTNLLGQCSREHHDLLIVWSHFEDLLHISPHICIKEKVSLLLNSMQLEGQVKTRYTRKILRTKLLQHLITLVKNEVPNCLEAQVAILGQLRYMEEN